MIKISSAIFKTFFLSLCIVANTHFAFAQTASILPPGYTQYLDSNGKPLSAGKVYNYIPNTTTPKTTWQDAAETIPNANPVILDAGGRAKILGDGSYRQIVKDRNNVTIWDAVTSSTGSGSSAPTATGDGDLVGTIKPWAGMTAPNQYAFTYGQEVSRTTYATLYTAITSSQSVFCNSGSPTLNGLSDTTNFWIGMSVEVSCVAAGFSTIVSKTSSTVTLAANANVTTNVNATFFPWGRGNGTTTFNLPDLRGVIPAGNNNMGGVASSNLTTTYFGATNPNSIGALGGSQSNTLTAANSPSTTTTNIATTAVSVTTSRNTLSSTLAGGSLTGGGAIAGPGDTGTFSTITASGTLAKNVISSLTDNGGIAASATISAAGSGYTNGSQTITVSGGTCTTQPQFTVTVSGNAFTGTPALLTAGSCTVAPANPAATTGGGGTGGTLNVSYSAQPFSLIPPTRTTNFIIKITPDSNSATASGVTSLGSMTGDIACGAGLICAGNIISSSGTAASLNYTPPYTGGVTETQSDYNKQRLSIMDFGALGNTKKITDGAISIGTAIFTSATAGFTSADVGKVIRVNGAGAAGITLETTISGFTNSTTVTLTANASTTVTGATTFYGTDDTAAIQNAINTYAISVAIRAYSCLLIPNRIFITTSTLTVPAFANLCMNGAGASIVSDSLGSIIQPSRTTTNAIDIQSSDPVFFSDFGIYYVGAAATSTTAIKFTPPGGAYNYFSRLTNVYVYNAYNTINADRVVTAVFDNVVSQSFTHTGLIFTSAIGSPVGDAGDNRVINSHFLSGASGTVGIYWTGGGGLTAIGNKFNSGDIGIQINPSANVNTSQIVINSNSFDGMDTSGVYFSRQDATSAINQLVFNGNTCNLWKAVAASCFVSPTDAGGVGLTNLTVANNVIYGPSVAATLINIDSVANTAIEGNALQSNHASSVGINLGSAMNAVTLGQQTFSGTFANDWVNASSSFKVANAITPNLGGVIYSATDRLANTNGTATANLPLLSGNIAAPTWAAITYPTSATSGGIPYFSSTSAMASSAVLAANAIVIGGGAGAAPSTSGCTISSVNAVACSSSTAFAPSYTVTNTTNDANGPQMIVAKSRTSGNTNSGDALGYFVFQGFANSAYRSTAVLQVSQAAAVSGNNVPSKILMSTSNASGIQNQQQVFDNNAHSAVTAQSVAPTLTAGCNGAGSSIAGGGGVANDTHGTVTGQTAAATTCTLTFGVAFTNTPDCIVTGLSSPLTGAVTVSTTTLVVNFGSTANYKFSYMCRGV